MVNIKFRDVRPVRSPIEEGRVPFKLLLRDIAVTLEPVTVIPYQVLTGPVNQLSL